MNVIGALGLYPLDKGVRATTSGVVGRDRLQRGGALRTLLLLLSTFSMRSLLALCMLLLAGALFSEGHTLYVDPYS